MCEEGERETAIQMNQPTNQLKQRLCVCLCVCEEMRKKKKKREKRVAEEEQKRESNITRDSHLVTHGSTERAQTGLASAIKTRRERA